MSYEPTEWKTGEIITANKLNKMEQGIADAGSGSSGGVTDYNDLENKPISVTQTTYENDKSGETGELLGTTFYKISDAVPTLKEMLGSVVNGETTLTSANTMDIGGGDMVVIGFSPDNFETEPPMGMTMFVLGQPMDMQEEGISVPSAGIWADETIVTLAMKPKVDIDEAFSGQFLPDADPTQHGRVMQVDDDGNWTVGAQIPIIGVQSWREIKRNVKLGRGATLYPVHTILNVRHKKFGSIPFEVVAHDVDADPDDNNAHTMTLLALEGLYRNNSSYNYGYEFDAIEKICNSKGINAGQYHVGSEYNAYSFTLTQDVPNGGYIAFENDDRDNICTYDASGELIETVPVTDEDTSGTDLATVVDAADMNHIDRSKYGSGNYKQSAIRQWLNADGGNWWQAQTDFDLAPSYKDDDGFLAGIDSEFKESLLATEQTVGTNDVYETGDGMSTSSSYTVTDKVFLAGYTQIGGTAFSQQAAENTLWTAFDGLGNDSTPARVKYRHGTIGDNEDNTGWWWLRSPNPSYTYYVRYVKYSGNASNSHNARYRDAAVAPACVI